MREIELTQGRAALVDDEDYEELSRFSWYAATDETGKVYYAVRGIHDGKGVKTIRMHRVILNAPRGMAIDHIDGNGLNNQRSNLRLCTNAQNAMNRGRPASNSSGFKGVSWFKNYRKWRAVIRFKRKLVHIGYFDDPESAARAYDEKARELFGRFAYVNT